MVTAHVAPRRTHTEGRSVPRVGAVFVVLWIVASLLGSVWALATPLGASPDEPAHLIRAASVARGEVVGESSRYGNVVNVPRYVADAHGVGCYAFWPDRSAACANATAGSPSDSVETTTTAGFYNPLYYAAVGWPSLLFDDASGVYAMRIVSAVLCAAFLALAASVSMIGRRPWLILAAFAVAGVPTLLFLCGAVNPNALETTAVLAAFACAAAVFTRPGGGRRDRLLLLGFAVSGAVAVNTRGLAPLWIAIAVFAALLLGSPDRLRTLARRPMTWTAVGIVGAATAFGSLWTLMVGALPGTSDTESFQEYPGVGTSPLNGFLVMLLGTFDNGRQMIASFGWLDTEAPEAVYFAWSAVIGVVGATCIVLLRGRRLLTVGGLVLAFVLIPALIQGAYVTEGGYIWQGRYALPLFVVAVLGAAVVIDDRLDETSAVSTRLSPEAPAVRRLLAIAWPSWAFLQTYAFAVALQRNGVGVDGTWRDLFVEPEWSAPGGNAAIAVGFGLVAAATAVLALRTSIVRPGMIRSAAKDPSRGL